MKQEVSNKIKTKLRKGIQKRTILFLLLTLIANSYAWFVYVTQVSNEFTAHVKNWEFKLQDGDRSENFEFTVESIYPGMEEASQTISTQNLGEIKAELKLEPTYLKVLDEEYTVGDEFTQADLIDKMSTGYPFKILIFIDGEETNIKNVEPNLNSVITVVVKWDFESGNDAWDTEWGNKAYQFNISNPNIDNIKLTMKITASQVSDVNLGNQNQEDDNIEENN